MKNTCRRCAQRASLVFKAIPFLLLLLVASQDAVVAGTCSTAPCNNNARGTKINWNCGSTGGTYACCDSDCSTSSSGGCGGAGCSQGSFTCSWYNTCDDLFQSYSYCCLQ